MDHLMENLKRPKTQKRAKKRVGRGNSSGKGTYSGKGLKGQKARSGGRRGIARRSAFQQLIIRTPKLRGFKRKSFPVQIVNLSDLNRVFNDGDFVNEKSLIKAGLAKKGGGGVKVLGSGKINKKLNVKMSYFSKSAKSAIEKSGGKCESL